MKVALYCINRGQPSQYYGLKTVEHNHVLHYAPNNWKTIKGACRWAERHGYEVDFFSVHREVLYKLGRESIF